VLHRHMSCSESSRRFHLIHHCSMAHSQDELEEWQERYNWQQVKRGVAKERELCTYMESLINEYNKADLKTDVVRF
jgi:hypothetical protein